MTVTISRLYNNHEDARAAVRALEDAGVAHGDISILASNADNWYAPDRKVDTIRIATWTGETIAPRLPERGLALERPWGAQRASLQVWASLPFPAWGQW